MAFVTVEDLGGQAEIVFFPEAYGKHRGELEVDRLVFLKGTVDARGEGRSIIGEDVIPFSAAPQVLSRAIAVPAYLRQLGYLAFNPEWDTYFNWASKGLLFASGILGALIILSFVFKAYFQRRKVQASLVAGKESTAPA